MLENLFLFTGPDSYFLHQALTKWQDSFTQKFGSGSVLSFSADNITLPALQEALQGGGLFASKKLIVCHGIPDDKITGSKAPSIVTKYIESLLDQATPHIGEDIILIFTSLDPDKRGKLYKLLQEKAQPKSFPIPSESHRRGFIQQRLGDVYQESTAEYLLAYVGDDSYRLSLECDKIRTYMHHMDVTSITTESLHNIVYSSLAVNNFAILDAVSVGDLATTMKHIDEAMQDQTSWNECIGMMYRGLKHMIITAELYQQGVKQAKDIAAIAGIHFFPIAKNLKHITYLAAHTGQLKMLYHDCIALDAGIKSGAIPQEGFWSNLKMSVYRALEK